MRLHDFRRSNGYEMLHCIDERWEVLLELNGTPVASSWKPLRVRRVRATRREACRPSDSPYYGGECLMFRRSAVDALRDMLDAFGELLPLEDEGGVELFAYHPRALDALDYAQSKGWRNDEGGFDVVDCHVFFPSVVEGVDIFKLANERAGGIFLSERFVQRWKQAKLKGLDFILAWDSDLPPEAQPNIWTTEWK